MIFASGHVAISGHSRSAAATVTARPEACTGGSVSRGMLDAGAIIPDASAQCGL